MGPFDIGDRVEAVCDYPSLNKSIHAGDQGIVCEVSGHSTVGVNWDLRITNGHSCDGKCEPGHGWRVFASQLRRAEPEEDIDIPSSAFMEIIQNV